MEPPIRPGPDRNKICPRCGAYQTHFSKTGQPPGSSSSRLLLLLLPLIMLLPFLIGLAVWLVPRDGASKPSSTTGLLIPAIVILVLLVILRKVLPGYIESRQSMQPGQNGGAATVYSLHCSRCGHRWQKTEAQWDEEGQAALEGYLSRLPAQTPGSAPTIEDIRAIQWEEPNPRRGAFLVISAIFLLCIISVVILGLINFIPYKSGSYYTVLATIGTLFILLLSIGVMFVAKSRLVKLLPIVLILLFFLALRFFGMVP